MKIYTSPYAHHYKKEFYKGKITVLVDIFRATTTILHLFSLNIKEIILLENEEELNDFNRRDILKIGEKFGEKLDKFDYNNSPSMLIKEKESVMQYKKAIMLTTNGTKAALKAVESKKIYVGAFNNINAVLKKLLLLKSEDELIIALSGDKREISLEDTLFAGNLLFKLREKEIKLEISDFSLIALTTYEKFLEDKNIIKLARHYKRLKELGFRQDIDIALKSNIFDFVPEIEGKKIFLKKKLFY